MFIIMIPYKYLRRVRFNGVPKYMGLLIVVLSLGTIYLIIHLQKDGHKRSQVINMQSLIEINGDESLKSDSVRKRQYAIRRGDYVPQCGLQFPCQEDSFSIHIYTGKDHNDTPKLCVNNHYIFNKDLNNAGRGLNIVLIDSSNFKPLTAKRFDTYDKDATELELFLEKYPQPGDIVVVFTFDEAATKLSDLARKLFYELGSGVIQNMKFRSSWYMVTQKGIKGFTPFEKMSLSSGSTSWGNLLDDKFCVPKKIIGQSVHPDSPTSENKERRSFCKKYNGYGEFCSDSVVDEPLTPVQVLGTALVDHPIFRVPIIVLAGTSVLSLPMTLETIIRQPGIKPDMVIVFYLPAFAEEATALIKLFKFKFQEINDADSYEGQVDAAFNKTVDIFPDADHIIFIEEELVLSPDYLAYMSQVMSLLEKDPTLYSISAWNDNGYQITSSDPSAVYRVEGFPGLAFMISKTTYIRQMQGNMKSCCQTRAWHGWNLPIRDHAEMVIPDISRVVHLSYEGLGPKTKMLENMFNRERLTNLNSPAAIDNPLNLISNRYEQELKSLLEDAVVLEMSSEQLQKCNMGSQLNKNPLVKTLEENRKYALYYAQKKSSDYTVLVQLCKCFGLFNAENEQPRGLHKDLLRFSMKRSFIFLVGSKSPYFKFAPTNHQPLSIAI